jgi:methionyl-tRNA formyltransferase
MRLVFFGTGEFGLPTLNALFSSRHKIAAVVTQPDKTGRGHHTHFNPIKDAALGRTRPLLQPENVNDPAVLKELRGFGADIFVTAAYGQILKQELLDIPPRGAVNLHASILPKYRGAAPIQAAILNGEMETGVTIFRIVRALDAGPILMIEKTPIGPAETTGELHDRLAQLAVPLTMRLLDRLEAGEIEETKQDDAQATYARQLRKEEGEIDWSNLPAQIVNHVRAMTPWPGAFSTLHIPGRPPLRVTFLAVEPTEEPADAAVPIGGVLLTEGALVVQSGGGPVRITRLKPAGKKEMTGGDFRRGYSLPAGAKFGPASIEP